MADVMPPEWIRKRDGRTVPFEADKISRALFAGTEALGHADAFLARELADSVVHFLAIECEGRTPTTDDVAETVEKVVRELGQPALATAFHTYRQHREPRSTTPSAAHAPAISEVLIRCPTTAPLAAVLSDCARQFALQTVFSRDLVAAQTAGLLTLTGLERPDELASCVVAISGPPFHPSQLVEALEQARRVAGETVVLDGPEHLLARQEDVDVPAFAHYLTLGLRLTGLRAVVNLNGAAPPAAIDDLAGAPLFVGQRQTPDRSHLEQIADALAYRLAGDEHLRIDWHLAESDFASPRRERLERMAQRALSGASLGFVMDRPRRTVALAEGLDRRHPESLMAVGLHLPVLAAQPGTDGDPERFITRLASLARLALSAGRQRRAYLRRQRPGGAVVAAGFRPDRARLMVVPVGLDHVIQLLSGKSLNSSGPSAELGKRILQRLRDVLHADHRSAHAEACIDGPFDHHLGGAPGGGAESVAGLTAWDAALTIKAQGRAVGPLHAIAEGGTLALFLPEGATAADVVGFLETVWRQTEVIRVRLVSALPAHASEKEPAATDSSSR